MQPRIEPRAEDAPPLHPPEIHLFVLWSNARSAEDRIVADLREEFELLAVYDVAWPPDTFRRSLHRFYGHHLLPKYHKEDSCGTGPFLAAVVRDRFPRYDDPSVLIRGGAKNARIHERKKAYRQWTFLDFQVHGSDTSLEAAYQVYLATGRTVAYFEARTAADWDGVPIALKAPMPGNDGWPTSEEMLAVLRSTQRFAVLPAPTAPEGPATDAPELDLVVEHIRAAAAVLGGWRPRGRPPSNHNHVWIGGRRRTVRLRTPGDGFLDPRWQSDLLQGRDAASEPTLDPEAAFWVLLYQTLVHHPTDTPSQRPVVARAAARAGIEPADLGDRGRAWILLQEWMNARGYTFTEPADPTVWTASDTPLAVPMSRGRRWRQALGRRPAT